MRWKKRHDGEQQTYTARGADETKWIKDQQVRIVQRGFTSGYDNVDSVNESGDEHPAKPGDNDRELQPNVVFHPLSRRTLPIRLQRKERRKISIITLSCC